MRNRIFLLTLLLLGGCQTIGILRVDRAPDFEPRRIRRVMVVAQFKNPEIRKSVEAEFVKQWKERGVECVSGAIALPAAAPLTKEGVKGPLAQGRFDSVLVLRVLERKSVSPGEVAYADAKSTTTAHGDKSSTWEDIWEAPPVYTASHELVIIESTLYEVATERRLWSSVTESRVFDDVSSRIAPWVKRVLERLTHPNKEDTITS